MPPTTGLVARESPVGFTICFDWVMRATRSPMATWLYGLIWRYAQMRERACYASCAHLAEDMGVSTRQVHRLLRRLLAAGLITCLNPAARGVPHRYLPVDEGAWRQAHGLPPRPDQTPDTAAEAQDGAKTSDARSHPPLQPSHQGSAPRSQPPVPACHTRITNGNTIENERNSISIPEPTPALARTQGTAPGRASGSGRVPDRQRSRAISKSSSRKSDPRTRSPAVQALRTVTGYYPPRGSYAQVIAALGEKPDLPRLRECYAAWCARGYNPRGLNWALQWYADGSIPTFGKRRATQQGVQNDEWDHKEMDRWAAYYRRVKKGENPDALKQELGL